MSKSTVSKTIAAAALLLGAAPASAQLPNPSAASVGMANSYTVMARGLSAVAWNPAGLAMPGSPGFSISILPLNATAGLDPVSLADIAEHDDGTLIPDEVKREWLNEIMEEGSQQGNGGLGLTYLAMNVGRFGVQVGTSTIATADMGPGIARLLLFGNAEGDSAVAVDAGASEMTFGVVSTAAVSYAHPLTISLGPLPDQHFSLGATLKYSVGHFLLSGEDMGSRADVDPLEMSIVFPTIMSFAPDSVDGVESEEESVWNKGSGIGVDVGAMWQGGIFSAAVSIRNLMNTFEWNVDDMWYSPGEAFIDGDSTETNFDARPLAEAPQELRDRVDDLGFPPVVALAGAVRLPLVTVSAEVRQRTGDALSLETGTHAGVAAEFRPLPFIPIRAGLATLNGGFSIGGGLGLEFGVFNLNAAASRRTSDLGTDVVGALTVSFGGI